ncbi:uncharacterized protein BCR38DRAFT_475561 [Pseudomassariella vexata]|uniref:Uncharacterized protein n=1 Tax=Pseudomassariella vexata TaxID=1141098 RepID=A0A1Y2DS91_9PEZI|nr:uncharacterized protein BCR38DRAFT_475561 [Pseudomassariella vexata]ORY62130.1 hypothetical protein BCR38DRAFT_475561 [Pseudomassariella vexata]
MEETSALSWTSAAVRAKRRAISHRTFPRLAMPWDLGQPVTAFDKASFKGMEWNRDGKLELGEDDFFRGSAKTTLDELAGSLGTATMVTRWRQAHPQLVGTEKDCVAITMGLRPEDSGEAKIKVAGSTLLLFR